MSAQSLLNLILGTGPVRAVAFHEPERAPKQKKGGAGRGRNLSRPEVRKRQREGMARYWANPEAKRAHRELMRRLWADPAHRAQRTARMKHARQQREGKR